MTLTEQGFITPRNVKASVITGILHVYCKSINLIALDGVKESLDRTKRIVKGPAEIKECLIALLPPLPLLLLLLPLLPSPLLLLQLLLLLLLILLRCSATEYDA